MPCPFWVLLHSIRTDLHKQKLWQQKCLKKKTATWAPLKTCIFQTLWWLHCNFSTLSLLSVVCFCSRLKALPLIVSICQSIVWMRSPITDLAWGQLDFSWFNWIYDMSQIQTSRDCFAMTASLLHIKNSFHNALWLWAWQMVKRDEII